jgi:membrane protein DedA with SNARE-associated domain
MDISSRQTSPSRVVVGSAIGVVLMAYAYAVYGWVGCVICTVLALYEGWTLVNKYEHDTITETIQSFAAQTALVPFMFGVAVTDMYHRGYLAQPWQLAIVVFLMGHFFMGNKLRNWRQGRR